MNVTNVPIHEWLLRISVAFAFLYPPFDAILHPYDWIGYFPKFLTTMFSAEPMLLLHSFGVVEVIIALWILSGWKIRIPATIAVLMLAAIVVFNASQFPILFRDVSIALAALALAFWPRSTATRSI